jgi:XTP/dITP diphosphohydrolase
LSINKQKLLLATTNRGKTKEFRLMLAPLLDGLGLTLSTLSDLSGLATEEGGGRRSEPVEDGGTFRENAGIKARHYSGLSGLPTLADDSGLSVDALNGGPGVRSARLGGPGLTDAERCLALLELMRGKRDRRARFEACLVLAMAGKSDVLCHSGRLDGTITERPVGSGGFGYDPVFIPAGSELTLAQLDPSEKNKISHRSRALESLAADVQKVRVWLDNY